MEEKTETGLPENEQGQTCENKTEEKNDNFVLPIKFNKQVKNLSFDEAVELAQKGLKYDMISDEFSRLKNVASKTGKSVNEFIDTLEKNQENQRKEELLEKCNGNSELADHIIELESKEKNDNSAFSELKSHFPEIKSEEDLPFEVIERAKQKGSRLLDEYLRYILEEKEKNESTQKTLKAAKNSSIGSQRDMLSNNYNPERSEFLKGLWGK